MIQVGEEVSDKATVAPGLTHCFSRERYHACIQAGRHVKGCPQYRPFKRDFDILGWHVVAEKMDPLNPLGRFGGGWQRKVGFQANRNWTDVVVSLWDREVRVYR